MKKIFSLVLAFIVSAAFGFVVVKLIDSSRQENNEMYSSGNNAESPNTDIKKGISQSSKNESIDSVDGKDVKTGKELPENEKVNSNMLIEAEALAAAEEAKAEKAKAKAEVAKAKMEQNRMSAAEFQMLISGGDNSILGGKNPKVAKTISFSVSGLREGDRHPQDIVGIRAKVGNGIWTSFSVHSVGYDSQGRINSAVIVPNYPD